VESPVDEPVRVSPARAVGCVALWIYCALLVIASIPDNIRPGFLDAPHERIRKTFARLNWRAGSFVFGAHGGDVKRDMHCVIVEGRRKNGDVVRLFTTFDDCIPPTVKIVDPAMSVIMNRITPQAGLRRLTSDNDEVVRRARREYRHSPNMAAASKYFCYSKQVDAVGFDEVVWTFYERTASYETGKRKEWFGPVLGYDCAKGRRLSTLPYTATWDPDYGPGSARNRAY
jgi:hypothetical protein